MRGCPKTRIDIFKKCCIERALLEKLLMMMMILGLLMFRASIENCLGLGQSMMQAESTETLYCILGGGWGGGGVG